jgi:hypothetical protein
VTARPRDPVTGLRTLRGGLEPAGEAGFLPRFVLLRGKLGACLGRAGEIERGLYTAARLARRLRGQGRFADALALLCPVYDRFTKGFDTADLKSARVLLDTLG